MKLPLLLQSLYHEPALIIPQAHASIRRLVEHRLLDQPLAREPGQGICGETVEVDQMEILDGVAHIPINGVIGQDLSPFERGDGAVDVMDIMDELTQAQENDEVHGAVLLMDTPGGMVTGTPELADRIARFDKPIFAFSRNLIASAGYWVAAATDGIFTTRSASVGSIGVYVPWIDSTAALAAEGLRVELIKAGKFKGMGFPGTPLTDDQRHHLQQRVDQIYKMFTATVTDRRGEVATDTMQGQTFLAPEALERNLIDGIVSDLTEVLDLI